MTLIEFIGQVSAACNWDIKGILSHSLREIYFLGYHRNKYAAEQLRITHLGNLINIKVANDLVHADKKTFNLRFQNYMKVYNNLVGYTYTENLKKQVHKNIDHMFGIR